jgi:hypothetical protein
MNTPVVVEVQVGVPHPPKEMNMRDMRSPILVAALTGAAAIVTPGAASAGPGSQADDNHDVADDPEYLDHLSYDGRIDYDANGDGIVDHSEADVRHFDRDRDGFLSPREHRALAAHKAQMRRGGDGRLTPRPRGRTARAIRAILLRHDRNRDGYLSRWEARRAGIPLRFADRDRDGYLSRYELRMHLTRRASVRPWRPWRQAYDRYDR